MVGKLGPEALAAVLDRTGAPDDAVLQGAAYGEDAAAIDLGDRVLVVSSDPISLAATRAGTLGVHVACNDVAASGADPRWLTSVVLVPDEESLEAVVDQLDSTAEAVGVSIVGGHTEFDPARDRPLLSLTALGVADRFVSTGGARTGDRLLLTKGAAIEGTAILASDFGGELDVPDAVVERGVGFFESVGVIPDARALREYASAMHDPTEGGVLGGCYELASASGRTVEITRAEIPVADATAQLCTAADVDPLRVFGSGALLATVPAEEVEVALAALSEAGIEAAEIGRVRDRGAAPVVLDGNPVDEPVEDDMYQFWA